MNKLFSIVGIVVCGLAALVAFSALEALPVKWLWNGTAVPLFGVPVLDFWNAWGLSLLCGILFKSVNTK